MLRPFTLLLTSLFLLAFPPAASAQVPQLINYQGRVIVDGVNFDGAGQFKFALVNTTGTSTYWSNDGSSTAGSQPTAAVTLTVTKGLYSVLLGDATLANMTIVPATVFTHGDVHLRVWFNDGTHGFEQLAPDKRIAAVGYAMMAADVPDGIVTTSKIADGAITASKISAGAVGTSQLAPGAASANLAASGQSGVASGGIVIAASESPALLGAGYSKIGTTLLNSNAPASRAQHSAIWTGSEMIVWGGYDGNNRLNTGARYNPVTNTWAPVSVTNAPSARLKPHSMWSGSEMIVWGGANSSGTNLTSGGRYDPVSNTWLPTNTNGAVSSRDSYTVQWSGTEMIVWGGRASGTYALLNDGGRYNPSTDSWTTSSNPLPLSGRNNHSSIWTGSEMILWGGEGPGLALVNDGFRYTPSTNTWVQNPSMRVMHLYQKP
jgi:hypothetical protein